MVEFIKPFYYWVEVFFLTYLIVYSTFLLISVTVGALSLYGQRRRLQLYNVIEHDYFVPITIIVPAHNENITVIDTVESLLHLDYRLYEIIVVDDGSTDNTAQCLINHFKLERMSAPIRKQIACKEELGVYGTQAYKVPITLIRKKGGGKSDALNMGINAAANPYFICMDADSMLQVNALKSIVRPLLEEPDVVACGGLVRIVNDVTMKDGVVLHYRLPRNPILCMQVLEYDRTFLASRLLFDKFNGNLIISGAFGLFKKDLVIAVGGYDSTTMGEDMELVVRLHAFCRSTHTKYRIKYAPDAICWSQAPANLHDLMKQRRRWHVGLFQSIWSHRNMLFNPQYGVLSFVSFLYYLLYELLSPYIEVFGVVTILIASSVNLVNYRMMIFFFLMYAVFGAVMSLTAFFTRTHSMNIKLALTDVLKVVLLCLFENIGLRMILAFTRFFAFVGYKSKKSHWGKIQRSQLVLPTDSENIEGSVNLDENQKK